MNILYIGYWGANEGLSQSTINPHLGILKELGAGKIFYFSIERSNLTEFNVPDIEGLRHIPLKARKRGPRLLNKLLDFLFMPAMIIDAIAGENIDLIICRTSLAGYFGMRVRRQFAAPIFIESFEPHADYMVESGVWSKGGLSTFLQRKWESEQKKKCNGFFVVSENYKRRLIDEGVDPGRIEVAPCAVNIEKFKYNKQKGTQIKEKLNIPLDAVVGVYVGKFGGMYMFEQVIQVFQEAYAAFPSLHIILVTPQTPFALRLVLDAFDRSRIFAVSVPHKEVNDYLSAADFAFSTQIPSPSKKYLSPIKIGEYWAAGLPVLLTKGVGDDSDIIKYEGGGAIFDDSRKSLTFAFDVIKQNMCNRSSIRKLALKYRSFDKVKDAYIKLLPIKRQEQNSFR